MALQCIGQHVHASTTLVPDQISGIQDAIDAGADTIVIRSGTYDEAPFASRGLVLIGIGPSRPRLQGLYIDNGDASLSPVWHISGLHFASTVSITTYNPFARLAHITFDTCTLDSTLEHTNTDPLDIDELRIARSRLIGRVNVRAWNTTLSRDTVQMGVTISGDNFLRVEHCQFIGSASTALNILGHELDGTIDSNVFADYIAGVRGDQLDVFTLNDNVVRNIVGVGIDLNNSQNATFARNDVQGCHIGIRSRTDIVNAFDNVIAHNRSTGLWSSQPFIVDVRRNIIARNGADGVYIGSGFGGRHEVTCNTIVANVGSGIDYGQAFDHDLIIQNNIVSNNGEWGLTITAAQRSIALGCNDWFSNELGAVSGPSPDLTDFDVDPLFCDLSELHLSLRAESPLVKTQCGQIGAGNVGCGVTSTLIARLTTLGTTDGVLITWECSGDRCQGSWVERTVLGEAAWESIGFGTLMGAHAYTLLDTRALPGVSFAYRIAYQIDAVTSYTSAVQGSREPSILAPRVHPNPTFAGVEIAWWQDMTGPTQVEVYDLVGRLVAKVAHRQLVSGRQTESWDGRDRSGHRVAAGWYLVRITQAQRTNAQGVLLLK